MPVAITIRNVPEHVRDELAARAARSGRSLQEYLLRGLEQLADNPDPDDWLSRVRQRVQATGSVQSADQLLADRDVERR